MQAETLVDLSLLNNEDEARSNKHNISPMFTSSFLFHLKYRSSSRTLASVSK